MILQRFTVLITNESPISINDTQNNLDHYTLPLLAKALSLRSFCSKKEGLI
ncbi:MAG: hypothetical protein ACI8YQ_004819 [Polaribacter sp.]